MFRPAVVTRIPRLPDVNVGKARTENENRTTRLSKFVRVRHPRTKNGAACSYINTPDRISNGFFPPLQFRDLTEPFYRRDFPTLPRWPAISPECFSSSTTIDMNCERFIIGDYSRIRVRPWTAGVETIVSAFCFDIACQNARSIQQRPNVHD